MATQIHSLKNLSLFVCELFTVVVMEAFLKYSSNSFAYKNQFIDQSFKIWQLMFHIIDNVLLIMLQSSLVLVQMTNHKWGFQNHLK